MRSLIPILAGVFLFSCARAQDLVINEVMSANLSTIADEDEDYPDWIEIYHAGDDSIDLSGYGLSDDINDPFRWIFPGLNLAPGDFLLVFASGKDRTSPVLHANFRLDFGGELLLLTNSSGEMIDQIQTGCIPPDVSRGRQPDGGMQWCYFPQPTPGESNLTPGYPEIAQPPEFSPPGGFYSGSLTLMVDVPSPQGTIRYTLDGSPPSDSSDVFSSPLTISATTVIRARTFESGLLFSDIVTHSYIFYQNNGLPVATLSTDPANLWDEETGIYAMGNNPGPPPWYWGANFWQDWERPIHIEFFEPNGDLGFSADVGVKIVGGGSRAYPQKALALYARDQYGYNAINYQIFPDQPIEQFQAIVLRNSGNDWYSTMMRDALMTGLVADRDLDVQAYRPSIVFLNGEYWGIHNVREKMNEHYIASHHGADPDNLDFLEDSLIVLEGDTEHYSAMIEFIETHDMSMMDNYNYIKSQMEVYNFINYEASEIYFSNTDWPGNNLKYWRPRETGGRWRWMVFDTDFGFGLSPPTYTHNTLAWVTDPDGSWANAPWSTFLLRSLLENPCFRTDFINYFADLLNVNFHPDTVINEIETMAAAIEPEMPAHQARWDRTMEQWLDAVEVLKEFAEHRVDCVRVHIQEEFELDGTASISLNVDPLEGGRIQINSVTISEYPWDGVYFKGNPISLTALPSFGYRFGGWVNAEPEDSSTVTISLIDDVSVTAVYRPDPTAYMSDEFRLLPNYPNPFNLSTRLTFHVPQGEKVSLIIYDLQGREVETLVDQWYDRGIYHVNFQAHRYTTGIYFARLTAGDFQQSRKLLLIK